MTALDQARQEEATVKWFEYHCYEGHDSSDAEAWYRSHCEVEVLGLDPDGEPLDSPEPSVYRVRFPDGLEYSAWEDELVDSPADFYRPDPPRVAA